MIEPTSRQSWLGYLPLARQAALLKDDLLDPVDKLLDDPALVELVRQSLASRYPGSTLTGRPGIAPDRLLRCCVMKHLKGWSFRDLERELRSNLVYRRFTHYDEDKTPDFSTFSRTFALLSSAVTEQIHQRVVGVGREQGVTRGRKLRTDTTVVETNIHYPTDSTLWGDGIRVLGRSLKRIGAECKQGALEVVDHGRAVKRRLLEICRAAKSLTPANQQRLEDSCRKLLGLTRGVGAAGPGGIRTLAERAAQGGGRSAAGGNSGQPVAALPPLGREGYRPDAGAPLEEELARGGQNTESVRSAHPSHPQRETGQAHRVWEAGADRRSGKRHRERI